jgi:uncharacterized protein YndB with AHSA1/START domain
MNYLQQNNRAFINALNIARNQQQQLYTNYKPKNMTNNMVFETELAAKKIHVEREFNAPVEKVWKAWTDAGQLDQWWGSKPWVTKSKSMDFTVGGDWLYAMVGPDGQEHASQSTFMAIENGSRFAANTGVGHWDNKFVALGDKSKVVIDITFDDEATITMLTNMGFEGGTAMSFAQLDEFLNA